MVLLMFVCFDSKIFCNIRIVFLELGKQALIREIEGMRVCPVLLEGLVNATGDMFIPDLDGKFTPAVEATGGKVDGADDCEVVIGHEQLRMRPPRIEPGQFTQMVPAFSKGIRSTGFMTQSRQYHQSPTRLAWELSLATGTEWHLSRPLCIQEGPNEPQQPLVTDSFDDLPHQFVVVDFKGRFNDPFPRKASATSTVRVLSQVTVFECLFQKNNHL
jgi:hypothetical protein